MKKEKDYQGKCVPVEKGQRSKCLVNEANVRSGLQAIGQSATISVRKQENCIARKGKLLWIMHRVELDPSPLTSWIVPLKIVLVRLSIHGRLESGECAVRRVTIQYASGLYNVLMNKVNKYLMRIA